MIDAESRQRLKDEIRGRIKEDRLVLDQLRQEIRPLKEGVRRIQPRSTTAVSLVATDGGENTIAFDPFLIELVRVVDSSSNAYSIEVVTSTTKLDSLSRRQFNASGSPVTPLGEMMASLGVRTLTALSPMLRTGRDGSAINRAWGRTYRELVEWAVLLWIIRHKAFGSDTILIFDGLLRSMRFATDLFPRYLQGIQEGIARHAGERRKVFLAGVAKHSKVLDRYRLAMALEGVLTTDFPAYVEVPREIEERAYVHAEHAGGDNRVEPGTEINRFVGGKMFFVKFGSRPRDPIWPIDVFLPQVGEAATVLGCMLADAQNGFPVPSYPRCLQRAHEHAALVDFDRDILQDQILDGLREALGRDATALDAFRLQDVDPAEQRYGRN